MGTASLLPAFPCTPFTPQPGPLQGGPVELIPSALGGCSCFLFAAQQTFLSVLSVVVGVMGAIYALGISMLGLVHRPLCKVQLENGTVWLGAPLPDQPPGFQVSGPGMEGGAGGCGGGCCLRAHLAWLGASCKRSIPLLRKAAWVQLGSPRLPQVNGPRQLLPRQWPAGLWPGQSWLCGRRLNPLSATKTPSQPETPKGAREGIFQKLRLRSCRGGGGGRRLRLTSPPQKRRQRREGGGLQELAWGAGGRAEECFSTHSSGGGYVAATGRFQGLSQCMSAQKGPAHPWGLPPQGVGIGLLLSPPPEAALAPPPRRRFALFWE